MRKYGFWEVLIAVAVFVIGLLLYKYLYNAVMATDWPDWIKFKLLS